jgi:hypothetical protein
MRFVISMTVDASEEGDSLLDWLIFHLVDERRAGILRALKAGRVAVDRVAVMDPAHRVVPGTEIGFQEAGDDPDSAEPWRPTGRGGMSR